jgi:hypothetical protein
MTTNGTIKRVTRRVQGCVPAMLVVSLAALGASGCASARAQAEPESTALTVPPPPARVLPPLEGGPIEAAIATAGEPSAEGHAAPRRRTEPRDTARESRQDAPREPAAESAPAAQEAPPETTPAPALQLASPGTSGHAEQAVRQALQKAKDDLGQVNRRMLSVDAQAQFDTATRFIDLANQAVRDKNLVFAQTLADKAGVIAAVLKQR